MKVEFDAEEVQTMARSVLDEVMALDLDKKDRAALRRWVDAELRGSSATMKLLTEVVNRDLQRAHARLEASPIKKPDWV